MLFLVKLTAVIIERYHPPDGRNVVEGASESEVQIWKSNLKFKTQNSKRLAECLKCTEMRSIGGI